MDKLDISIQSGIDVQEAAILHYIQTTLGLVIHNHQKQELHKAIALACQQFNCQPKDYLQLLKNSNKDSPVLKHLVAHITIGESYFFRDQQQMRVLKETLLPRIIARKRAQNNLNLRIWSAGCSGGEEIYSIAIFLHELIPDLATWNLSLLATDVNVGALQKGLAACYNEWSMRAITDYYKKKYFSEYNHKYTLSNEISRLVNFSYLNLNDSTYPSMVNNTSAQDLILCRNVLIYFDAASTAKVMQRFSASLDKDGYLMLGASDPVLTAETPLVFHPDEAVYSLLPFAGARTNIHTSLKKTLLENPPITPSLLPPSPTKVVKFVPPLANKAKREPEIKATSAHSKDTFLKLLNEGCWQELLAMCDTYNGHEITPAFLLSIKAQALANLGKLKQALQVCQESLVLDSTNKYSYLTLALIQLELNHPGEAEQALRKSLFLDPHFALSHFQLGSLLLRNRQFERGIKSLENALAVTKNKAANELIIGYKNLSYGRLTEILQQEIAIYKGTGGVDNAHKTQI